MTKEIKERTVIDREVKITLLSVLQKGYFEQKDIDLLKSKIKPLENHATTIFFRNYGKEKEYNEEELINEKELVNKEEFVNEEKEQINQYFDCY